MSPLRWFLSWIPAAAVVLALNWFLDPEVLLGEAFPGLAALGPAWLRVTTEALELLLAIQIFRSRRAWMRRIRQLRLFRLIIQVRLDLHEAQLHRPALEPAGVPVAVEVQTPRSRAVSRFIGWLLHSSYVCVTWGSSMHDVIRISGGVGALTHYLDGESEDSTHELVINALVRPHTLEPSQTIVRHVQVDFAADNPDPSLGLVVHRTRVRSRVFKSVKPISDRRREPDAIAIEPECEIVRHGLLRSVLLNRLVSCSLVGGRDQLDEFAVIVTDQRADPVPHAA